MNMEHYNKIKEYYGASDESIVLIDYIFTQGVVDIIILKKIFSCWFF